MREGWTYKKLGEVATYINGYAFKPSQWSDEGIPIIRIQNLNNQDAVYNYFNGEVPKKFLVKDGDILISWSASLGAYEWIGCNAYLNQHIFRVVFDKIKIDKYFFKYAVVSKLIEMGNNAHGATMRHIVKKDFDNTKIPFPPLAEQERIVEELDLLSSIIEKKKAQLEEYDKLAQSIFYDMFGDPVTNEKGWEVKKLGVVCEYSKTRISPDELTRDNYVGVENLLQNCKGKEPANKIPNGIGLTRYIDGDVLIGNIRPYLKKIWLASNEGGCNGDVLAIRRKQEYSTVIIPIYVFGCLSKDAFFDFDMQYSKGEKMPRGDKKEILKYPICLPPLSLQQKFADKIEAIERQKELIKQSIAETETLFDSRMDFYFN